jgi:hypothetical protein
MRLAADGLQRQLNCSFASASAPDTTNSPDFFSFELGGLYPATQLDRFQPSGQIAET